MDIEKAESLQSKTEQFYHGANDVQREALLRLSSLSEVKPGRVDTYSGLRTWDRKKVKDVLEECVKAGVPKEIIGPYFDKVYKQSVTDFLISTVPSVMDVIMCERTEYAFSKNDLLLVFSAAECSRPIEVFTSKYLSDYVNQSQFARSLIDGKRIVLLDERVKDMLDDLVSTAFIAKRGNGFSMDTPIAEHFLSNIDKYVSEGVDKLLVIGMHTYALSNDPTDLRYK